MEQNIIYKSLEFWFTRNPSSNSKIKIDYNEISKDEAMIDLIDIEELLNLSDKYSNLANDYIRQTWSGSELDMGVYGMPFQKT
jgi:hypothetical protein